MIKIGNRNETPQNLTSSGLGKTSKANVQRPPLCSIVAVSDTLIIFPSRLIAVMRPNLGFPCSINDRSSLELLGTGSGPTVGYRMGMLVGREKSRTQDLFVETV